MVKRKSKEVFFRASGVGNLMTNGKGSFTKTDGDDLTKLEAKIGTDPLTSKQREDYDDLNKRETLSAAMQKRMDKYTAAIAQGPLSKDQQAKLTELRQKRDKPFELSKTAKTFVLKTWLSNTYGVREPLMTPQLMKGLMCEQDGFALADQVLPVGEMRLKNKERKFLKGLQGECDTLFKRYDLLEDAKGSWILRTFVDDNIPELYFTQVQTYMFLFDRSVARLYYYLVNTPIQLVAAEQKRLFHKYGGQIDQLEGNQSYHSDMDAIEQLHKFDHIPAEQRIKFYTFEKDQKYIDKLLDRVGHATEYYHTLTLKTVQEQLEQCTIKILPLAA